MSDYEQPLPGGVRHGRTVRVGETVRKPSGPWTPTIQVLLAHLVAKGLPVPRPLGVDEQGRETLSYIEGRASLYPWPEILKTQQGIACVGRTLRMFHDAIADFVPPSPCIWQDFENRPPAYGEIVCHGDFGPYNLIWSESEIVGVVDWEFARPAVPMRDLAWAAVTCVPLRRDEGDPNLVFRPTLAEARLRLIRLLESYGRVDRAAVIDACIALRDEMTSKMVSRGPRGIEPWKTLLDKGMPDGNARDNAWLAANRDFLLHDG